MGGGGVRSEEMGQLAGWTRGTKGNGLNERRRQMEGGGVRRGITTTSRTRRGLEGRDKWPELPVDTADGSLMVRYGASAPRRQWTATAPQRRGTSQRLLGGEGWRDGSSTARDGARRHLDLKGQHERSGDGLRAQRRWEAMDSAIANGR